MMIEAILIVNWGKKKSDFLHFFFAPNIKGHMESHAKLY